MALIACPDCARTVSDLAVACPNCARPIASLVGEARAAGERRAGLRVAPRSKNIADANPSDATPPVPVLANALVEVHRTPSGKLCSTCGVDVGADYFRVKEAPGIYLCADCDDMRERAVRRRQARIRTLFFRAAALLTLLLIMIGLVALASDVTFHRASKTAIEPTK